MRKRSRRSGTLLALAILTSIVATTCATAAQPKMPPLRATLLAAKDVTPTRIDQLQAEDYNAIVLDLSKSSSDTMDDERAAAERIHAAELDLYYWIEVARHPPTADAHPLWMASLQGHTEWRRFFPDVPQPRQGEVIKTYPWTPILYRECFDHHLARVTALLKDRPVAVGVFLNDLQAAPSACGCGNPVCRWTTDYGPITTAERLDDDAAARFISEVSRRFPSSKIIPVWTTECEAHDREGLCAGVGCFAGTCWKEYAAQLEPVARRADLLGVLCLYKIFGQDVPHWRREAGWVEHALRTFEKPPQPGPRVATSRLIAVLQGWDVSDEELAAQIARAESAGVNKIIVAAERIEQGWQPRLVAAQ